MTDQRTKIGPNRPFDQGAVWADGTQKRAHARRIT